MVLWRPSRPWLWLGLAGNALVIAVYVASRTTGLLVGPDVQAAFAAGYTYVLRTNGEEHLLYDGANPAYAGLDPQHPSSWSTRSTCRTTHRSCSVPCTSRARGPTGRRSAGR